VGPSGPTALDLRARQQASAFAPKDGTNALIWAAFAPDGIATPPMISAFWRAQVK
jgi:hypothetical protein